MHIQQIQELCVSVPTLFHPNLSNEIPNLTGEIPKEASKYPTIQYKYNTILHSIQEFKNLFKNSRIQCIVREEIGV